MYFWRIEQLKEDIRQGKLNETERFKYVIITIFLTTLEVEGMSWINIENLNLWDGISSIFCVLISTFGFFFAYKANNGSKGTDFLGKYFSISFVTTIRFVVLIIPFIIGLIAYYEYNFNLEEEIVTTALDTIPFLIWFVALFWRICVHIKQCV